MNKKKIMNYLACSIYFATPMESVPIVESFSIVKLASIIFMVFSFINMDINRIKIDKFHLLFIVYILYIITTMPFSISIDKTFTTLFSTLIPSLIVSWLIINQTNTLDDIKRLNVSYVFGTFMFSFFTLYEFLSISSFERSMAHELRINALGQDQNEMAFLLNMGIVCCFYLLDKVSQLNQTFLYLAIAIFMFSIVSTGSRTGVIILITIITCYLYSVRMKLNIKVMLLLFVSICIILFYIPESTIERLLQTGDQISDGNMTGRGDIWAQGLSAFWERSRLLSGVGFNTYANLLLENYGLAKVAHNTYLTNFVELGCIGLMIFLSLVSYICWKSYVATRNYLFPYYLYILPLLIAMITLSTSNRRWILLFGLLITQSLYILRKNENIRNNTPT